MYMFECQFSLCCNNRGRCRGCHSRQRVDPRRVVNYLLKGSGAGSLGALPCSAVEGPPPPNTCWTTLGHLAGVPGYTEEAIRCGDPYQHVHSTRSIPTHCAPQNGKRRRGNCEKTPQKGGCREWCRHMQGRKMSKGSKTKGGRKLEVQQMKVSFQWHEKAG